MYCYCLSDTVSRSTLGPYGCIVFIDKIICLIIILKNDSLFIFLHSYRIILFLQMDDYITFYPSSLSVMLSPKIRKRFLYISQTVHANTPSSYPSLLRFSKEPRRLLIAYHISSSHHLHRNLLRIYSIEALIYHIVFAELFIVFYFTKLWPFHLSYLFSL